MFWALVLLVVIALLVFALLSRIYCTPTDRVPNSRVPSHIIILEWGVRFHFAFLAVVCICGDPEHHISTGVHQPFGDCNIKGIDVSGLPRSLYSILAEMMSASILSSIHSIVPISLLWRSFHRPRDRTRNGTAFVVQRRKRIGYCTFCCVLVLRGYFLSSWTTSLKTRRRRGSLALMGRVKGRKFSAPMVNYEEKEGVYVLTRRRDVQVFGSLFFFL